MTLRKAPKGEESSAESHAQDMHRIQGRPNPLEWRDCHVRCLMCDGRRLAHNNKATRPPYVHWGLGVSANMRDPAAPSAFPSHDAQDATNPPPHPQVVLTTWPMVTRLFFVSSALCFSNASRAFFVASFWRCFSGSFKAS